MTPSNIIQTLIEQSIRIIKENGFKGFIVSFKEYYKNYPPIRYHFYFWLYSKIIRSKIIIRNIQGSKMYLNLNDLGLSKHLFFYGIREPECTKIMQKILKKGMNIVDIGANIGYYALMEAKEVGKRGKIYAIEPFPPNFELLKKNIELNGYKNIEIFNIAISDKPGKAKMYISDKHNLCNMMESNISEFIEVPTITLDDFLKNKKMPDLIRMDIEGFEYYAIDGMEKTLKKCRKCNIFIEVHPFQMYEKNLDYKKPLKKLFKIGFKPTYIIKEYGPLREETFEYDRDIDDFFSFLEDKQLTPPGYTHGFGLFLEKS